MKGNTVTVIRAREAGSLADVPRGAMSSQRKVHGERPEGSSYCLQGRKSYLLTTDPTQVTCKGCLKLMEGK